MTRARIDIACRCNNEQVRGLRHELIPTSLPHCRQCCDSRIVDSMTRVTVPAAAAAAAHLRLAPHQFAASQLPSAYRSSSLRRIEINPRQSAHRGTVSQVGPAGKEGMMQCNDAGMQETEQCNLSLYRAKNHRQFDVVSERCDVL